MISKALFSLAITLGCWFNAITSAQGQELYFYLYNNTGRVITEVYVSPSEDNMWGRNLIPYEYVYDESQLLVFIPANYGSTCYFDLKVIATDGTWWKFSSIDICELFRITINWNGTYYAEWDE